jgi:hypothetical protein
MVAEIQIPHVYIVIKNKPSEVQTSSTSGYKKMNQVKCKLAALQVLKK